MTPGKRRRRTHSTRDAISLFAGAGGLDLGLEAAGFAVRLCVEIDDDARKTLAKNRPKWKLSEPGDIHAIDAQEILRQAKLRRRSVALLAGGPPCQPFSKSGYWVTGDSRRLKDPRARTLRAYLKVVEAALPRVILLENVKGLAFLEKDEGLRLLKREIREINKRNGTKYALQVLHLNAADYGVPQLRERVFIVASRDGKTLSAPPKTHAESADEKADIESYLTAWDALGDLDDTKVPDNLKPSGRWAALLPSIPEGQNYLWHTPRSGGEPLFGWRRKFWSFLLKLAKNRPSWTIQAEPGPATGPFHWRSRLLSTRELCRLQTFPDSYVIVGDRRSAHKQVGNAVPCALGELLGLEIRRQLLGERVRRTLALIPSRRDKCPEALEPARVPRSYLPMRRRHRDHPGTGLGPSARIRERDRAAVAAA